MKRLKLLIIATFFYSALSCEVSASFDLEIKDNKMLTGTCVTLTNTRDEANQFKVSDNRITCMLYDLFFVLERVTTENCDLWKTFSSDQISKSEEDRAKNQYTSKSYELRGKLKKLKKEKANYIDEVYQSELGNLENQLEKIEKKARKFSTLENTVMTFADYIDYAKRSEKTECWIAFVTLQNLHAAKIREAIDFEQIQICFTVNTTLEIPITDHMETFRSILLCRNVPVLEFPITTHMGIFKTVQSFADPKPICLSKPLSIYLHSFAGKGIRLIHPDKESMYTRPIGEMFCILQNNLPEECFLATNAEKLLEFMQVQENSIKYKCRDGIERKYIKHYYFQRIMGDNIALLDLYQLEKFWDESHRKWLSTKDKTSDE